MQSFALVVCPIRYMNESTALRRAENINYITRLASVLEAVLSRLLCTLHFFNLSRSDVETNVRSTARKNFFFPFSTHPLSPPSFGIGRSLCSLVEEVTP